MRRLWNISRGGVIIITTIILTTIVINATDNIGNLRNSLLGNAIDSLGESNPCASDMVFISTEEGGFCIDRYEASTDSTCAIDEPQNQEETRINLEQQSCSAVSAPDTIPWRNIARHQAELACAHAEKRLPSNKEWYRAALGTPDVEGNVTRKDCNIASTGDTPAPSGSFQRCVSSAGVYDMVGNLWEWVDGTVRDGTFDNKTLPPEGYVAAIDVDGVADNTSLSTNLNFNTDYFWIEEEGNRAMMRGGYWRSDTDGGIYALNAAVPLAFLGNAVGFRCVSSAR